MPVVPAAAHRRTETPNAVMTTLASPTLGATDLAVWRVEMRPGQQGPAHRIDAEQVWSVLAGGATVELDGKVVDARPGDALVLPAGALRRITADLVGGLEAMVSAVAGGRAYLADGTDRGVPPWAA